MCAYKVTSGLTLTESPRVASTIAGSSVTGYVFNDLNRSGVMDSGEVGVSGISVVLKESGGRIVSTTTDAAGYYEFLTVRESEVTVTFSVPESGNLRFNIPASSGNGLVSTVEPETNGLSAAKTFSVMLAKEKVHAALSGFYTLTYAANNQTGTTDTVTGLLPENGEYVHGEIATIKRKPDNLLKKGYEFKGWNTASDGSGTMYQAGQTIPMTEDVTLYAIWEKGSYTVYFNYRGATSGNTEQSRRLLHRSQYRAALNDSGTPVNTPLPEPTRTGYTFVAWRTSATATTGNIVSTSVFNLGADTTLYAHWLPKATFAIRYNPNGGSIVAERTGVSWEDRLLPAARPTRAGYTFSRWVYEGSDGTETAITATQTYGGLIGDDSITSITLKAQWAPKTGYTVTYDTDGGDHISNKTVSWTESVLPEVTPQRAGYVFSGWVLANTPQTAVTALHTYGGLVANDSEMTLALKATWTVMADKTVHYNTMSGTPLSSKSNIDKNTALWPTGATTRAGYTLMGWAQTSGSATSISNADTFSSLGITGSELTLFAIWREKSYGVSYDMNGGDSSAPPADTFNWTETGLLSGITNPVKAGYVFDGWYYGNVEISSSTSISALIPADDKSSITLTAHWAERTYTITYGSTGTIRSDVGYTSAGLLPDSNPVKAGYDFDGWYYNSIKITNTTLMSELPGRLIRFAMFIITVVNSIAQRFCGASTLSLISRLLI